MANTENTEKKEYVTLNLTDKDGKIDSKLMDALMHSDVAYFNQKQKGTFNVYKDDLPQLHPDLANALITERKNGKIDKLDATTINSIGKRYSESAGLEAFNRRKGNAPVYIRYNKDKVTLDELRASGAEFKTEHMKDKKTGEDIEITFYQLPKKDLKQAHPNLKKADIFVEYVELFVKDNQGKQITQAERDSIGTEYDERLGNQRVEEAKAEAENRELLYVRETKSLKDALIRSGANRVAYPQFERDKDGNKILDANGQAKPMLDEDGKQKWVNYFTIPKGKLQFADPALKDAAIYINKEEFFKKASEGQQISDDLKNTIGSKYNAEIGQKRLDSWNEGVAKHKAEKTQAQEQTQTKTENQTQKRVNTNRRTAVHKR